MSKIYLPKSTIIFTFNNNSMSQKNFLLFQQLFFQIHSTRDPFRKMKFFVFTAAVLMGCVQGQLLQGNFFQNIQLPQILPQGKTSVFGQQQAFSLNLPAGFLEQVEAYQDAYCEPFSYTPSETVPAKFNGPSSKLVLDLGECDVHYSTSNLLKDVDVTLQCKEPEIIFESYPMNYTSHHESAEEFCTKECEIKVPFGHIPEYQERVLHIFDGSKPLDAASLKDIMSKTFDDLLGGSFDASAFSQFDLSNVKLFNTP
eukprot:TRINITY_DN1926_c0_g1_i3.p1 TRINITY_DN1926_c0_g1~~TRINITY_DN1926_c0_g1_i3.p1  ORF type:complete len:256 (+),score=31.70 TRINITY_DN1926_c0_g1_i3:357-1124(+)